MVISIHYRTLAVFNRTVVIPVTKKLISLVNIFAPLER